MRIAYFDCFSGISGDMTVAAFLHAGMPLEHLRSQIGSLNLNVEISARTIIRSQIVATKFDVDDHELAAHDHDHGHGHSHDHDHEHSHEHDHSHEPEIKTVDGRPTGHGRSYTDIVSLITSSALSTTVQRLALKIFTVIGEAESKLHGVPLAKIHFHEVGGVDSIVDIVGTAVAMEYFAIDVVHSSVVRLGSGATLNTQHGPMPTPAPASLEILRGYPVAFTDVPFELTTPTGAGIIKALSSGVLVNEAFIAEAVGYGAGSREIPGMPNMLRVVIGEMDTTGHDDPLMLETNIDNLDPEIYPYVIERLLEAGAHDAFMIPIIMKKGRPGILLSALVPRAGMQNALDILYAETPTLGIRISSVGRSMLRRSENTIETSFGMVRVKEIERNGSIRRVPEYEECRRLAQSLSLPLHDVRRQLLAEINRPLI